LLSQWPESLPLGKRIENEMIANRGQCLDVGLRIGSSKTVDFAAKFLPPKPGLVRRAATDTVQGFSNAGKEAEHGKAFEGQEDFAVCSLLDRSKNGEVVCEQVLIHNKSGRFHLKRVETTA
jgi:hypothetical protein